MVIDYLLHITHDLGVSTLGNTGLLVNSLCILLEYSCWLRMQDERNCKKALLPSVYQETSYWLRNGTLIHSIYISKSV